MHDHVFKAAWAAAQVLKNELELGLQNREPESWMLKHDRRGPSTIMGICVPDMFDHEIALRNQVNWVHLRHSILEGSLTC